MKAPDDSAAVAIDNLIQFLLILGLCSQVLGFPLDLVLHTILPGAALSIVVGNFFYAWQSQRLSAVSGRRDVTALPYGINTVSLFAFVFLVMLPVKLAAQRNGLADADAARLAWQLGLAACLLSGVIELAGAFVAERIRRATPRAALLSPGSPTRCCGRTWCRSCCRWVCSTSSAHCRTSSRPTPRAMRIRPCRRWR